MTAAVTFAAVFASLYAAHSFGDHWVQTHHQACGKGAPTAAGRLACFGHVAGSGIRDSGFGIRDSGFGIR